MQQPHGAAHRPGVGGGRQRGGVPAGDVPHAGQPAGDAVHPLGIPGAALIPGANEHQEAAHGVGAHLPYHIVGVDHIVAALAHLFVVLPQNDALVEQPQERLLEVQQPHIVERLDEEARIEQVHHGVFGAAGVLVHRQPMAGQRRVHRPGGVVRAEVAQHIPRRIHKGVHRVGFPPGRAAALRADGVDESGVDGQGRFAGGPEFGVAGQQHRQLLLRHRHHAAGSAEQHRDGRSPVALAGNQPVAEAVGNGAPPPAVFFHIVGNGRHALSVGHSVILAGVGHKAVVEVSLRRVFAVPGDGGDDHPHRQAVLAGEFVIAGIVGRNAHHCAGAVGNQRIVGGEDGHALAVQPVDGVGAGEDAGLFLVGRKALDFRSLPGLTHIFLDSLPAVVGGQLGQQRMFRGQHEESYAKDGVDAGGEGADFRFVQPAGGNVKADFHALAAANPVVLHGQNFVGPVGQPAEIQQPISVVGDAEEPLLQIAAGDHGAAALAGAVQHLFVGQHGDAGGTPDHRGVGAVGQPLLVEFQEEPLVPVVILRQAADYLPFPIVNGADGAELAAHPLDVVHRPLVGVDAPADGGVFGGQAESVEADGMQHVVALHPAKAGVGVGGGHGVPVADVQIAGGVGIHGHFVPLGAGVVVGHPVQPVPFPAVLPFLVDGGVVEPRFALPLTGSHLASPQSWGAAGGKSPAARHRLASGGRARRPRTGVIRIAVPEL